MSDINITPAEVAAAIAGITFVAAHAAAWLPQGTPGSLWGNIRVILDGIAANYGNAKNVAASPPLRK